MNKNPFNDEFADRLFAQLEPVTGRAFNEGLPRMDLSAQDDPTQTRQPNEAIALYHSRIETDRGPIWVAQNAVMCACPDCQAPISVRTWLMIAQCWNCEITVELSEQQQQAVEELLRQLEPESEPGRHYPAAAPTRSPQEQLPVPSTDRVSQPPVESFRLVRLLRNSLTTLPAWLISFLIHLILLLILALILLPQAGSLDPTITLSTALSREDEEGAQPEFRSETDPLQFDSMLPNVLDIDEVEWREEVKEAEEDAAELTPDEPQTSDPEVERLKENLTRRRGPSSSFNIRDPRLRNEILRKQGGTTLTEAAVARGLRWLAKVQNDDGSWSRTDYDDHDRPRNRGDAAGTSLALLPFLGAGQTHESGKYRETVAAGLKWLLDRQKSDGDLRCDFRGEAGMYVHGQATIVLVEALSMTGDENLRQACERAIEFIEEAQHKDGGWRYHPLQAGDTSVFGWQIMALQSARRSGTGIPVDPATLKLAGFYLDQAGREYRSRRYRDYLDGALYRYLPDQRRPTRSMTAEALLCRMYLGWKRDDPRVRQGIQWLVKQLPGDELEEDDDNPLDLYYWYYGTQVMHHYGGSEWEKWNHRIRDLLYLLQEKKGSRAGSWDPSEFRWGRAGDRIYTTSLAICTLEVYYRHLPLFDRIKFEP